mmetsp:Transcript_25289/g.53418  ORF Transcript_25289/g.53418 Transcript_25289/m.53418 type:complete len:330 (-) Transcript_25289:109-1098(-)
MSKMMKATTFASALAVAGTALSAAFLFLNDVHFHSSPIASGLRGAGDFVSRQLTIDVYANTETEEGISVMNGVDLSEGYKCISDGTHRVPDDTFVPIFMLTRDRITSLKKTIDSYYKTIKSPFEIIIIDHDSDYPPMVDYLKELEVEKKITVHRLDGKLRWKQALEQSNDIIQDYLKEHPDVESYVFTDPDIAFEQSAPDVLLFYAGLLKACPKHKVVGPALQISDIPDYYTQTVFSVHNSVYEQHSKFWEKVPSIANWNGLGIHIVPQDIDTTFGMYRRETPFKRMTRPSIRAYAPYAAVHVDWYDHSDNLPADKIYYKNREKGYNNW